MIKDDIIKKALFISLFFHCAILTPWPGFSFLKQKFDKREKSYPLLVSYKIEENSPIEVRMKEQEKIESESRQLDLEPKEAVPEYIFEQADPDSKMSEIVQEQYEVKDNQIVSLTENANSEIIPESVLNYYAAIREEIKKKAFYYKPRFKGQGSVTILFGIASDGVMQTVAVDNEKSTDFDILRNAALKSIKYASPFPPFPEELKNDFITFSITIEFALDGS